METEDIIEGGIILGILIAIGFIIYEAFGFLNSSGATDAVKSALAPVATASDTLFGQGAGTPGTNSNLFYDGVDNFFHTGSIYDTTRNQ